MKILKLSDKNRKILGVCGGIAEYFEVDPTLIRLGWVVASVFSAIIPGIVAYFIAALIMPNADAKPAD